MSLPARERRNLIRTFSSLAVSRIGIARHTAWRFRALGLIRGRCGSARAGHSLGFALTLHGIGVHNATPGRGSLRAGLAGHRLLWVLPELEAKVCRADLHDVARLQLALACDRASPDARPTGCALVCDPATAAGAPHAGVPQGHVRAIEHKVILVGGADGKRLRAEGPGVTRIVDQVEPDLVRHGSYAVVVSFPMRIRSMVLSPAATL
jgi:hypothetical protein